MKKLCDFIVQVEPMDSIVTIKEWLMENTDMPEPYLQPFFLNGISTGDIFVIGVVTHVRVVPYQLKEHTDIQRSNIQRTIITVGEMIRVLQEYNLTAKIVFDTQGSYASNIQLNRDDIEGDDDIVTILV